MSEENLTKLFSKCVYSLFRNFEKGLKYPAPRAEYEKVSRSMDKLGKIMLFAAMGAFLICMVVLECVASFTIYFTTDLGRDSFVLPIPMWRVKVVLLSTLSKWSNARFYFFYYIRKLKVSIRHKKSIWIFAGVQLPGHAYGI